MTTAAQDLPTPGGEKSLFDSPMAWFLIVGTAVLLALGYLLAEQYRHKAPGSFLERLQKEKLKSIAFARADEQGEFQHPFVATDEETLNRFRDQFKSDVQMPGKKTVHPRPENRIRLEFETGEPLDFHLFFDKRTKHYIANIVQDDQIYLIDTLFCQLLEMYLARSRPPTTPQYQQVERAAASAAADFVLLGIVEGLTPNKQPNDINPLAWVLRFKPLTVLRGEAAWDHYRQSGIQSDKLTLAIGEPVQVYGQEGASLVGARVVLCITLSPEGIPQITLTWQEDAHQTIWQGLQPIITSLEKELEEDQKREREAAEKSPAKTPDAKSETR